MIVVMQVTSVVGGIEAEKQATTMSLLPVEACQPMLDLSGSTIRPWRMHINIVIASWTQSINVEYVTGQT